MHSHYPKLVDFEKMVLDYTNMDIVAVVAVAAAAVVDIFEPFFVFDLL